MKRPTFFYLLLVIAAGRAFSSCQSNETEILDPPNIIYILADDMGYGDVSALNPDSKIRTPNLDRLAREGMAFTDAHSGSSVCTPTRYGILTGRYAWRTTLKNGVTWTYSKHLIDTDRLTVASLLHRKKYNTACVGKWHLGLDWGTGADGEVDFTLPIDNGPIANGFDYFFGITASLDIPPYFYIENNKITATSIDSIEGNDLQGKAFWRKSVIGNDFKHIEVLPKLTEKANHFIEEYGKRGEPFFLYFPLPAPHTPILPTPEFQGKSGTNAYGDFVLMVDDVVGQIMKTLDKLGVAENTLLIFTSDNGCSPRADFEELAAVGHDPSYVYRGHKADIFEGGHRVPFLTRWPGKIAAGTVSDQTICLTDLLRTAASIVDEPLPDDAAEDSYDLLPVLLGVSVESPIREATVHHSINGSFSIRQGDWKLELCPGSGGWSEPLPKQAIEMDLPKVQLYNLRADVGETNNVAADHSDVVRSLTALMERYVKEGRSTPGAPQSNDAETSFLPPGFNLDYK